MGSCLLSSSLLLRTWHVNYLMSIWWIAFKDFVMSDLGMFRFLRSYMLLLHITPLTSCSYGIINGSYLSLLFVLLGQGIYHK